MSEELLINVSPMESRVAILSNGVLSEIYIERHNKMGLVGNIYVGTVVRVLPGMQAAFVDIGQSRTAFLHVNDMQKPRKENQTTLANNDHLQPATDRVDANYLSNIPASSDKIAFANATNLHQQNNTLPPRFSQLANPQAIFAKDIPQQYESNQPVTAINPQQSSSTEENSEQYSSSSTTVVDAIPQATSTSTNTQTPATQDIATLSITQTHTSTASIDNSVAHNLNLHELNNDLNNKQESDLDTPASNKPNNVGLFSSKAATNPALNSVADTNHKQETTATVANNTVLPLPTNHQNDAIHSTINTNAVTTNSVTVSPIPIEAVATHTRQPQQEQETHNNKTHNHDMEQQVVPNFRVLPTVTEMLSKESLTPSQTQEQNDLNQRHDSFGMPPTDSFTTSASKRQSKSINPQELIQNRLREGQRILVQVTKDQLGTKGARLTTNISLPSRYLVYLPSSDNIGISQRIDNSEERNRLKHELSMLMQTVSLQGGLIARTAAERIPTQKLEEDIYYLLQLWRTIQARQQEIHPHQSSVLVYQELSLPLRSIRDLVHEETERVVVDDANMYDYLRQFAHEFVPMIYPRIVPYHSQQPMFDVHRVEEDLRDALKRRVDLKSGGYLIIDQTEAMTTIDVNTGSYVGGRSLEDTVYKTNLEATHAIARQLRLRNLGGIIILDFIDMQEQEHRDDVLISLQTQLAEDYARTNITQVSELGLVEMTRKRTRESLEQQLCEPCSTCQGRGFIKTAETVCFEIFREIMRCARTYNAPKQFTVVAHAAVIDLLLTSEADTVADLEYLLGRVITFEVENLYTQEQYDIVLD